jgi:hypothetical protein
MDISARMMDIAARKVKGDRSLFAGKGSKKQ